MAQAPAKQEKKTNPSHWRPGQSGNPKGRPLKGHSITDAFKQMLDSQPEEKQKLVQAILKHALEGDMTAAKLIWNYMDGMPLQKIEGDFDLDHDVKDPDALQSVFASLGFVRAARPRNKRKE